MVNLKRPKTCDRFPNFRSPSDNGFISSFLLLVKGILTGVGQLRPMNWVLVKITTKKIHWAELTDSSQCSLRRNKKG